MSVPDRSFHGGGPRATLAESDVKTMRAGSSSVSAGSFVSAVGFQVVKWLIRDSSFGRPRGVLRVWPLWERLAHRIWPTIPVPGSPHGVMSLHFTTHRGVPFLLSDRIEIRAGDRLGEIHVNNAAILRALGASLGPEKWPIVSILRDELRAVSRWINQAEYCDVRALFGVTILWRAGRRFGFDIRPRPATLRTQLDRFFLRGLLILYTPEGLDRLSQGKADEDQPMEIWMSRETLLRRYGDSAPTGTSSSGESKS